MVWLLSRENILQIPIFLGEANRENGKSRTWVGSLTCAWESWWVISYDDFAAISWLVRFYNRSLPIQHTATLLWTLLTTAHYFIYSRLSILFSHLCWLIKCASTINQSVIHALSLNMFHQIVNPNTSKHSWLRYTRPLAAEVLSHKKSSFDDSQETS